MSAVRGSAGASSSSSKRGLNSKTKTKKQQHNPPPPPPLSLVASAAELAHTFLSENDILLLPSQTLTLESLLSSASSALSSISSSTPPPPPQPHSSPPPQEECWFSRFLLLSAADVSLWRTAFRMSAQSFSILLPVLSPVLSSAVPSVSPEYALAAAIYRLAHGAGYKAVGRRFGMDSAAACRAFYAVCKAVHDKLGEDLLEELRRRSDRDELPPNCCGALGFGRFSVAGEVLGVNGSLLVQALVNSEGRFLDVSAGWPGTVKPEAIFRQSKLYLRVEESGEDLLKGGGAAELDDGYLLPQYIFGDSCFPLLPWLLTPYVKKEESSFGAKEKAFNAVHCRAMGLVATAFRRVKARWQLLRKEWKEESMEFMPYVVVSGCLLHNFLIKCGEPTLQDDNVEECSMKQEEEGLDVFEGRMDESGERIRDALATHLSRVSPRR